MNQVKEKRTSEGALMGLLVSSVKQESSSYTNGRGYPKGNSDIIMSSHSQKIAYPHSYENQPSGKNQAKDAFNEYTTVMPAFFFSPFSGLFASFLDDEINNIRPERLESFNMLNGENGTVYFVLMEGKISASFFNSGSSLLISHKPAYQYCAVNRQQQPLHRQPNFLRQLQNRLVLERHNPLGFAMTPANKRHALVNSSNVPYFLHFGNFTQKPLDFSKSCLTGHYKPVYPSDKCLKTRRVSGIRTRQYCGFFTPVASMDRVSGSGNTLGLANSRFSNTLSTSMLENMGVGFQISVRSNDMANNAPAVFKFQSNEISVLTRDGNPWFIASEVAKSLGYTSPKDAASHLDADEKDSAIVRTLGGEQRMTIINESGLYALVLRSRKPEARTFAKWVTSEVLPSIRKTGGYGQEPSLTNRRWLISFDHRGNEIVQEIDFNDCLLKYEELPKLLSATDNPVESSLLSEIAIACITRLSQRNEGMAQTLQTYQKRLRG